MTKIPQAVEAELVATGLPWSVEKGGHHLKVFVNERLAAILPRSGANKAGSRAEKNVRGQIRRAARGIYR